MEVCYRYDGTFEGFLTCVFEAYAHREPPMEFCLTGDGFTLWEEREVLTHPAHAQRVYKALLGVSPTFQDLIERAFLTCLPQKELALYELIRRGLEEGDKVRRDLSDPTMAQVMLALKKMGTEWDHLKGFVRFSDFGGVMAGEIEPKNRVLPLLGPHFAGRFPDEHLALYDRTHKEILLCANGRWTVTPAENFSLGKANEDEKAFRNMWKTYFSTIAIEGRTNSKCQSTHLPKRYRHVMTEFQPMETLAQKPGKPYSSPLPGQTTTA